MIFKNAFITHCNNDSGWTEVNSAEQTAVEAECVHCDVPVSPTIDGLRLDVGDSAQSRESSVMRDEECGYAGLTEQLNNILSRLAHIVQFLKFLLLMLTPFYCFCSVM